MKIRKIVISILLVLVVSLFQPAGWAASAFSSFDRNLEKEIGYYNYHGVLAGSTAFNEASPQTQRVKAVLNRITPHTERGGELEFKITVVEDPTINAFALPGGYIFVNSGLLATVTNDSELAGVLAHEVAHIERRHGMKALYRTAGMGLGLNLLTQRNQSKYKVLIERLAALSLTMVELGYSREAEFEADRYGVELLTAAGYNKLDLVNFWKRMIAKTGDGNDSSAILRLFSTHPPLTERIKRIETL